MINKFIQWLKSLFRKEPKSIKIETLPNSKMFSSALLPEEQLNNHSRNARIRNVRKHLRIASRTVGHEREVHLTRAEKLITRYRFTPLDRALV